MSSNDWRLRLADVASDQSGLITTAQARSVGVTPQQVARLAATGVLERVGHGVHRLSGAAPDLLGEIRAAWLALEPETQAFERLRRGDPVGVVSHRSAAAIYELGDIDADVHEFAVSGRRRSRNSDVRFHNATYERDQWTVVSGLPVTTVAVTIGDLARTHTDGGHLAQVVTDALTGSLVDIDQAAEALRPYAHHYGAALGDGVGLVTRFVEEADLSDAALGLAEVALATRAGSHRWVNAFAGEHAAANLVAATSVHDLIANNLTHPTEQWGKHIAQLPASSIVDSFQTALKNQLLTPVPAAWQNIAVSGVPNAVTDSIAATRTQLAGSTAFELFAQRALQGSAASLLGSTPSVRTDQQHTIPGAAGHDDNDDDGDDGDDDREHTDRS